MLALKESAIYLDSPLVPKATADAVTKRMADLGAKLIGTGIDKSVYGLKDGKVCIVFVDLGHAPKYKAHMRWMNLCERSTDPHLLKVYSTVETEMAGVNCVASICENLRPLPSDEASQLSISAFDLASDSRASFFMSALRQCQDTESMLAVLDKTWARRTSVSWLPQSFLASVLKVIKLAPQRAILDLHGGNIMARGSTYVIVDPWYVKA